MIGYATLLPALSFHTDYAQDEINPLANMFYAPLTVFEYMPCFR